MTGTQSFASLDGSSSDHDGTINGIFTVNDGNLAVNGVVNCNDDLTTSACSMAFNVSGNMSVNTGGALYAENRSGSGTGGAITLTVGGNLALNGNAIVSTASKSSSGAAGGAITANVGGSVALASGTTIDSGSANAAGGAIVIAADGTVSVNGNVLSGPSRTFLATRLSGGAALDGGTSNNVGGAITISSATFAEPAVLIGSTANIVSQGADNGAGPVTIDGCGIQVYGLVAALSRKAGAAKVAIRSGKDVVIDGRDLGGSGTRMGRVRADAPSGTALNKGVDVFATETIDIYGPASGLFVVTSLPGLHDSKSYGGLIRITSLADAVNASGNVIDDGHTASGDTGGTVEISAKEDVNLNTAVIRAHGDFNTGNNNRGGGSIEVRSHSGDVIWTNGTGDVRPVGSTSGLPLADQGSIVLTACGTVDTTGSSFPVNGTATSVFPETHTGVCSPAAPSLPSGVPPLITCNTPPVANDASATTNEDTTVTITLSGSDADGDPLTFSIVSGPSNGVLGPIVPTGPTTATVNYTPNLNFNGPDSFVYEANDGNGGTDTATVSITVVAVNDAPSFLAGPTVTVLEDSGPQTYPNWATSISAGPADESGQTVTFTVTAADPSLFSVQPAVASNGTLTFTPAANAHGTSSITVTAHDNGGTANGGVDTSVPQSSSITITAVNDEPSFTAGGDVTVNEDSGAYSAAWASAISAGPNESGQTVAFVTSNDNNGLFSVQPSISSTGVLTFTPAANASGSAVVTVYLTDDGGTANGGDDTSASVQFTISVTGVNDEPSFTAGGDVSVLEDSGAYSATWATDISAGAGEPGQTVTFFTSNDNNGLFSVQPSIDASGTLTFTTAPNVFGSALVTVYLQDDGGTANGGDDTSASVQFTINVTGVNDEPSFTAGGDVTVAEDSGAYSAAWASAISAGPNEGAQTVTFVTSNNNNGLFSVQPSISSTGVLSFTPAPNAHGTATVSVYLTDNGGTANGGDDTSSTVTFDITVTSVNDPPTAGNDSWETEGNTELRVDLGAGATPHVADTTPSGKGVADNDSDPVEGDPVTITGVVGCADVTAPYDCTVTGGTVSLNANGSFSFQPAPGAAAGSFQYTVTDGTDTATATVSIIIHDRIWYVNGSAPAGGNGTSSAPFNDFAPLNGVGDVDGAGDYIFVHTSAVTGSIALENGQKLWGQGVGLIIPRNLNGNGFPTTIVAPGVRPTVTSIAGDTVLVDSVTGVEVAGLNIASPSGNGIDVTSSTGAASASIYSNGVNASGGEGIDINANSAAGTSVAINTTDVVAMGDGVNLLGTAGDVVFSYSNGSVTSMTGSGIVVDGSAADSLVINGMANVTIGAGTPGQGISINAARFDANAGTAAFDTVNAGTWTVATSVSPTGGTAVALANVSGDLAWGSLSAHGTSGGVTIGGSGLFAGASGMQVTSGGGAVSATAGTGLSVTNASIGAANLSFTSISSSGAVSGIVLNNTGTVGGLQVLGTGAANSGGTIANTSSHGISLTSTAGPAFNNVLIQNTAGSGVKGTGVSGFAFTNGTINNSGTAADDSNIAFNTTTTGTENNLSGTVTITGNTLNNALWHGVDIANYNGTLANLVISNNTVTSATTTALSKGSGIRVQILGSASSVAHLTKGTVANNTVVNFPSGAGIQVQGGNAAFAGTPATLGIAGSVTDVIDITGNLVHGLSPANRMGTSAILATVSGRGQGNLRIDNNGTAAVPLGNTVGTVIGVGVNGFATATVTTSNNFIVANNSFGANGISGGTGVTFGNTDTPTLSWTISGNSISATDGNGILTVARGATGTLKLKVLNNVVAAPLTGVRQGIRIDAGNAASINDSVCVDIAGNTSAGSGGATGIGLRKQGTSAVVNAFGIAGLSPSPTGSPNVEAHVNALNPAGGGTQLLSATSGFTACTP
ncbi:MAG TPA: Ig-like domain-containing protein [Thermoanaerobaculia bacterium]